MLRFDIEEKYVFYQMKIIKSIDVAAKLTREEYDILTLWFVSQYIAEDQKFYSLSDLKYFIENYILPFLDSFNKEKSWYPHLVYTGCGFIQAFQVMDIYSIIYNKSADITPDGFYNIFSYLVIQYPNIESLFRVRNYNYQTQMHEPESCMSLTSVGIAIGYANLCRVTGEKFDLSKWI